MAVPFVKVSGTLILYKHERVFKRCRHVSWNSVCRLLLRGNSRMCHEYPTDNQNSFVAYAMFYVYAKGFLRHSNKLHDGERVGAETEKSVSNCHLRYPNRACQHHRECYSVSSIHRGNHPGGNSVMLYILVLGTR